MAASEQDRKQIAAVIEQYRRGVATMDLETLKGIWDQDYNNIFYHCSGGSAARARPGRGGVR